MEMVRTIWIIMVVWLPLVDKSGGRTLRFKDNYQIQALDKTTLCVGYPVYFECPVNLNRYGSSLLLNIATFLRSDSIAIGSSTNLNFKRNAVSILYTPMLASGLPLKARYGCTFEYPYTTRQTIQYLTNDYNYNSKNDWIVDHVICSSDDQKDNVVTRGSSLTLLCDGCIDANTTEWSMDEQPLTEFTKSALNIVNFSEDNVGNYSCFCTLAQSGYTQTHRVTLLPIDRPLEVSVKLLSNTTVRLEWNNGISYKNRLDVVHPLWLQQKTNIFYVIIPEEGTSGWDSKRPDLSHPISVRQTGGNFIVLDDLVPGMTYAATVNSSWLVYGREYSRLKTIGFFARTQDQTTVYTKLGEDVTLDGRAGMMSDSWYNKWLYDKRQNGFCQEEHPSSGKEADSKFLNLSFVIPNDIGENYEYQTIIKLPNGFESSDGEYVLVSEKFNVKLLEYANSTAIPTQLVCSNFTDSSFSLAWNNAESTANQHHTKHRVIYWKLNDIHWRRMVNVDGSTFSVQISDLEQGTIYKLAVVAIDTEDRHSKPAFKVCSTATVGSTTETCSAVK